MSARKTESTKWSEEDVDALLVDFFRRETPRELPRPAVVANPAAVARTERLGAGYKGVAAAACALLVAVTALSTGGRQFLSPANKTPRLDVDSQPVVAKKADRRVHAPVVAAEVHPQPPKEYLDILTPELRNPADNGSVAGSGDDVDPFDIYDRLDTKVYPLGPSQAPKPRPRLPEERP